MFEVKSRVGIVVWVYNMHSIRQLRRYGLIYYSSKKMKYVYLYVDQDAAEKTKAALEKLHFVRKVELSHRPELITEFGAKLDKQAKVDTPNPMLREDTSARETDEQRGQTDAHHIR